jgi:ribonuclease BN (tRNA processing enzyme)
MRLTILGGSAAAPNIGQGCSGYLIAAERTRLVLDLGPGTLAELRRHADYRGLDGVIASHMHLDHTLDLLALGFALAYDPVRPAGRLPLWLPPDGDRFLDRAAAAFAEPSELTRAFSDAFALGLYDPASPLIIGEATIRFAPTEHYVPCWAIRVTIGDGSADVVYTADTGPAADLVDFARGAAALIAEATYLDPPDPPRRRTSAGGRGHLTAGEAGQLARAAGVRTLVLTHLCETVGIECVRERAIAAFSGRIELARPGMSVEW